MDSRGSTTAVGWILLSAVSLGLLAGAPAAGRPRRPEPSATTSPVGLRSAAEERAVRAMAEQLGHTMALVVANPEASFPGGSLAAQVREAFLRFDEPARARKTASARKALAEGASARRARFGAATGEGLATIQARRAPGLDPALSRKLRALISKRLDDFVTEIEEPRIRKDVVRLPRTWIELAGLGETDAGGGTEITIDEPQVLGFRWKTEEAGAAVGHWELRQMPGGLTPERVLATGTAPDSQGRGIEGFFEINLVGLLPPAPPVGPGVYHVRVMPMPKAEVKLGATATTGRRPLGKVETRTATTTLPPDPKGVGPWSEPVVIYYRRSMAPPQTFTEVYRRADFHLESLHMVEDQHGPGPEEFHVAGFIQAQSPAGVREPHRLGSFFAKLDPDGPTHTHEFGERVTFQLPSGSTDWPKRYVVLISILEEDDGGSLQQWLDAVWQITSEVVSQEVDAAIKAQLGGLREQLADDVSEEALEHAIDAFEATVTTDFLAAWVKMLATIIVGAIEGGLPDDYYGTEVIAFLMPTNQVQPVHDDFALRVTHKGHSEPLRGQLRNDGSFRVQSRSLRFYGQPSYPEAGAFDGIVDIWVHWVLRDRGL